MNERESHRNQENGRLKDQVEKEDVQTDIPAVWHWRMNEQKINSSEQKNWKNAVQEQKKSLNENKVWKTVNKEGVKRKNIPTFLIHLIHLENGAVLLYEDLL